MSFAWKRVRDATTPLSKLEMSPREREILVGLRATTMANLSAMKQSEFLAAMSSAGQSESDASAALQLFAEYLARADLRFAREHPITVETSLVRPTRTMLPAGFVEHIGADAPYCCWLLAAPREPQQWPDPHLWSWSLEGFRLTLQVRPTQSADIETLAPPWEANGVMREGPWGAVVEADRIPTRWNAAPNHSVQFFDAELGYAALAEVEGSAGHILPKRLAECAHTLALSLSRVT